MAICGYREAMRLDCWMPAVIAGLLVAGCASDDFTDEMPDDLPAGQSGTDGTSTGEGSSSSSSVAASGTRQVIISNFQLNPETSFPLPAPPTATATTARVETAAPATSLHSGPVDWVQQQTSI